MLVSPFEAAKKTRHTVEKNYTRTAFLTFDFPVFSLSEADKPCSDMSALYTNTKKWIESANESFVSQRSQLLPVLYWSLWFECVERLRSGWECFFPGCSDLLNFMNN